MTKSKELARIHALDDAHELKKAEEAEFIKKVEEWHKGRMAKAVAYRLIRNIDNGEIAPVFIAMRGLQELMPTKPKYDNTMGEIVKETLEYMKKARRYNRANHRF